MGKISVLDKAVAEKIAAGEVVERPSSVVKELIENSFDALATSVTVEIEKGGTSYIRVTDNGSGIASEDVATAFLRHATSKIKDESDLENIATLGFRGEALCSVSAVSRTEMITRTQNEEVGTYMAVEGGEAKDYHAAGCPLGTTITVRNLFFNTPARMKFLKKDATEAAYITDICQRAALSHPEVSFRYIRDGRDIFFTPGDNQIKNTVRAVFGKDISNAMVEVDSKEGVYAVRGLTGSNNLSRPNRNMQYFFVNGRLVKSALLSMALTEAYKNELMVGKFPVCVLDISLPCDMVDVNVHPAKTEVKFVSEEEVYRNVVMAVRDAITKNAKNTNPLRQAQNAFKMAVDTPKVVQETLKGTKSFVKSTFTPVKPSVTEVAPVKKEEKKLFAPVKKEEKKLVSTPEELPVKAIETLKVSESEVLIVKEAVVKEEKVVEEKVLPKEETVVEIPDFEIIGQIFGTYIILESDNEMILIDQHAAHERINYEKIKNQGAMKQTVLLPVNITLTAREMAVWEENREFFDRMGFETEVFGNDSIIVRALPSDIDYEDGEALLLEIIGSFMGQDKGSVSEARDKAIYTVACKAAIKANHTLSVKEMDALVRESFALEGISTCPHGRPIRVNMTKYHIEKMFKRIV
ncbi:MAG: DNA mismatch repair endonuclease MutL [Clostridia bacterium]|nr:DNA mismatch repair endonuclease MutL [Clostridia bacterium]